MFGLGMPEILLILAIALIVIGPKKLPDLAKTLGKAMGEFKRSAQDFKRSIDIETTVKDIKDIDLPPAPDLKEVLKDANEKKEGTVDTDFSDTQDKVSEDTAEAQDPEAKRFPQDTSTADTPAEDSPAEDSPAEDSPAQKDQDPSAPKDETKNKP